MGAYEAGRTVVASSARTATGTSAALSTGAKAKFLNLLAAVTAVSGVGPTLDLSVEWSNDATTWATAQPADTFTQITAAANAVKQFAVKAGFYRIRWTIGGTTPSFTFAISAYLTD